MLDDLRHYRADLGSFQLLTPDQAVCGICVLGVLVLIFWPYIK